jgi:hypothetical protein
VSRVGSTRCALGLLAVLAAIGLASPAWSDCRKSIVERELPGEEPQRAQRIDCDEDETPALLEGNAHLTLCDPAALSQIGASFEACSQAVGAAREGLRQAKIRAALRSGTDDALITERYGASSEEIDAARAAADLSGPIAGAATETTEEEVSP